jgi:RNA polymerase sigma factor (sigma-70 family)
MESNNRQEPGSLRLVPEYLTAQDRSAELALEDVAQFYTARRRNFFVQAFAMVRNHAIAEDLTQEAFARLVVEVKSGKTIQSAVNWTSRVLRNLALNHLEHNKVVARVIEPDSHLHLHTIPEDALTAEESYLAGESRRHLRGALSQLAPLERECVLMFAEGHSYKEIARRKNLTYGVAMDMVRRSLRKLRKQLPASRR